MELAKEGIKVTPPKDKLRAARRGLRWKRRGKNVSATKNSVASSNGLNIEALVAAKALVVKLGSVEAAEKALSVLKKLG